MIGDLNQLEGIGKGDEDREDFETESWYKITWKNVL